MNQFKHIPAGETAFLIKFGNEISEEIHKQIIAYLNAIKANKELMKGVTDLVPSYADLLVYYNPLIFSYKEVLIKLKAAEKSMEVQLDDKARLIEIPVCYGGIYGEDLDIVAAHNKLSPGQVVEIHTSSNYLVYMLGFTPGFSYLGGMDKRIATPRKEKPRTIIPTGSVGIAGSQTGIYPIESPGGWQLIGKTPVKLFDPDNTSAVLLRAGDRIRFVSVNENEFKKIQELIDKGTFQIKIS